MSALKREHLPINRSRLEAELVRQQLKVWWVAEQIKVDRKTISRWLAGTVKAEGVNRELKLTLFWDFVDQISI